MPNNPPALIDAPAEEVMMTHEQIAELRRARMRLDCAAQPIDLSEVPSYLEHQYHQFEMARKGQVLMDNWAVINAAIRDILEASND